MGTNYFCREKIRKSKEIHIGKKSFGWSFIFHAYEKEKYGLEFNLISFTEWENYLLKQNIAIYDESRKKINASKFLAMIEASSTQLKHSVENNDREWIDEKGFVFLNYWFG